MAKKELKLRAVVSPPADRVSTFRFVQAVCSFPASCASPLSILNLHRGNILRVIADGDSRIGQLKRAASCGHKVAERDAEVDFLDIPACFRGLDQRALFCRDDRRCQS